MKDIDLQDLVGKLETDDFFSSFDCNSLGNISYPYFYIINI
jgi:hypothetical protein